MISEAAEGGGGGGCGGTGGGESGTGGGTDNGGSEVGCLPAAVRTVARGRDGTWSVTHSRAHGGKVVARSWCGEWRERRCER